MNNQLYTNEEFASAKYSDKLPIKCSECNCTFHKSKHHIALRCIQNEIGYQFCSMKCYYANKIKQKNKTVICKNCGVTFSKKLCQCLKHPSHFCSHSCSTTYHNTHKTYGYRRSKFEIWIETQLSTLYPKIEIHYNRCDAIGAELDIYIPSIKLAFELNGIFHYEPIYGTEKLNKTQSTDNRKFQTCLTNGIELCIIDVSKQKYFKETNLIPYLNIITSLIDMKIKTSV